MSGVARMAVLPDFLEEGWMSMDYCADRVLTEWPGPIAVERRSPAFRRWFTQFANGSSRRAFNLDRAYNRFWLYPRFARRICNDYDLFHVVDHSYAHLVRSLPAERTGVTCHDIDAFRSVLEPARERRSRLFRAMTRQLMDGLGRAAVVFTISHQTRDQLLHYGLVDPARLVYAPLGVGAEFHTNPPEYDPPLDWLEPVRNRPWILHVGSCVPRKRIDVLLEVFALARREIPDLQLVKISGEFSQDHREQIRRLELASAITHRSGLSRTELAAAYRAAPLVLMPSELEGFGLPVIEALACGARVLASDIPALHEAGGDAAVYRPVGDVAAWAEAVVRGFRSPGDWPGADVRAAHAARFTWAAHCRTLADSYAKLLRS